jgi:hypothetical protein
MTAAGGPVRVLFLLQRPEAWINFASVWAAMRLDPEFSPTVWLLPYNAIDPELSARRAEEARSLLDAKGVPFVEWREGMRLARDDFHVAIFNHPYDRERPTPLWFSRVADAIPHSIYIPYGLPMGGGRKNLRLQYAQPTQIRASAVVARSPFEKAQYAKHCPAGDGHVFILGHPRFDVLLDDLAEPVPDEMARACRDKIVFLWSSHFSFGHVHSQSSNFSTFDLIGPELFEFAAEHREKMCLLWRPHPGLLPTLMRDHLLAAGDLPRLRAELKSRGAFLDDSPGHSAAFRASDALIADTGSFLIEYLVTGNPVLALMNPEGEPLNEEGEALLAHYSKASSPQELEAFMMSVLSGELTQTLDDARANHLPIIDGAAGERVARLAKSLFERSESDLKLQIERYIGAGEWRPQETRKRRCREEPDRSMPVEPTPVLDDLCRSLREVRQAKMRESRYRKQMRRYFNMVRASMTEFVKQQAPTGSILGLVRSGRRSPPN